MWYVHTKTSKHFVWYLDLNIDPNPSSFISLTTICVFNSNPDCGSTIIFTLASYTSFFPQKLNLATELLVITYFFQAMDTAYLRHELPYIRLGHVASTKLHLICLKVISVFSHKFFYIIYHSSSNDCLDELFIHHLQITDNCIKLWNRW